MEEPREFFLVHGGSVAKMQDTWQEALLTGAVSLSRLLVIGITHKYGRRASIPADEHVGAHLKCISLRSIPLAGIEPASPPSEGGILSIERQGVWTV